MGLLKLKVTKTKCGKRNDYVGYGKAVEEIDKYLGDILNLLKEDDLLFVTADHGCDPTVAGTDHTREMVPLLVYKKDIEPYLNYTIQKYGLNFIHLYDDSGIKKVPLDEKDITWFHKINHENKTYINAFVKDKNEFNFYIENGWEVNRIPINAFKEYTDVRYKVERRILRKFNNKRDKEKYLSSLL